MRVMVLVKATKSSEAGTARSKRPAPDEVADDTLRLVFAACHPALPREARVALTLRLVASLSTDEIARAFLIPEPTIAQRIVRANRTLTEARIDVDIPVGDALLARLSAVLEVIYLVNEGHSVASGELADDPALASCHLLPAVQGHLLLELGRRAEARVAFERALELTANAAERSVLARRVRECRRGG